jgi:hypothetical protein
MGSATLTSFAHPTSRCRASTITDATGRRNRALASANLRNPRRPLRQQTLGLGLVWCAAFSPDSRTVALSHQRDGITLWDVKSGQLLRHIPEKNHDRIVSVTFSPDGQCTLHCARVACDRASARCSQTTGAGAWPVISRPSQSVDSTVLRSASQAAQADRATNTHLEVEAERAECDRRSTMRPNNLSGIGTHVSKRDSLASICSPSSRSGTEAL